MVKTVSRGLPLLLCLGLGGLSGCNGCKEDSVSVTNSQPGERTGLLVAGKGVRPCPPYTSFDSALSTIPVGRLEPLPTPLPNEVIAFSSARRPTTVAAEWTPGPDEIQETTTHRD